MSLRVIDLRKENFLRVSNSVIDRYAARIGPEAVAVYVAIVRFAGNHDGQARVSVGRLAELLGRSERFIERNTRILKAEQLIEAKRNLGVNSYFILDTAADVSPTDGDTMPINVVTHDTGVASENAVSDQPENGHGDVSVATSKPSLTTQVADRSATGVGSDTTQASGAYKEEKDFSLKTNPLKPLPDFSSGDRAPASDLIYGMYPRKIAPRKAKPAIIEALKRLVNGERGTPMTKREAVDFLAGRVRLYAGSPAAADPQFIPYPERWFKYSRYLDDDKEWQVRRHDNKRSSPREERSERTAEAIRRATRRTPARDR